MRHARQRAVFVAPAAVGDSSTAGGVGAADVERTKVLLDREGYKVLDIRAPGEFESSRITKPARCSTNIPWQEGPAFAAKVTAAFPGKGTKLLINSTSGGADADAAVGALVEAGYTSVVKMEGGYEAYDRVWSPSGKRRPPAGRWVSTGKEALKSGLNIPGVAESYDEGGNLVAARWAKGLDKGQELPK